MCVCVCVAVLFPLGATGLVLDSFFPGVSGDGASGSGDRVWSVETAERQYF